MEIKTIWRKSPIVPNCFNPTPIVSFPPFISQFLGPENETIGGEDSISKWPSENLPWILLDFPEASNLTLVFFVCVTISLTSFLSQGSRSKLGFLKFNINYVLTSENIHMTDFESTNLGNRWNYLPDSEVSVLYLLASFVNYFWLRPVQKPNPHGSAKP